MSWHDDSNVRARVRELAEAQCTDGEVSATLAVECEVSDVEADSFVAMHADVILRHRLRGRAEKRVDLAKVAGGDAELGKQWTRSNVAALEMFGRQHLGYTSDGMDAKTRKLIERAERERAKKGRGLRAV